MVKELTVKELIAQEIDIDVCDDVTEELYIAFCGPVELTEAGAEHFADVLKFKVTIIENPRDSFAIVNVDDPDNDTMERNLKKTIEFFHSAAGYCSGIKYTKFFKE